MTPKEKIYKQILETQNATDKVNGKEPRYNVEGCLRIKSYCQQRTMAELNKELELAELTLRNAKHKKSVQDWLDTPEGIAYRNDIVDKISKLRNEVLDAHRNTTCDIHHFINRNLSKKWRVRVIGERAMTIELLDNNGKHQFGYDVELYYGYDTREPDTFEISCSSVGGYDPTKNQSRYDYFTGLATLSKDDVARKLKAILQSFSAYCYNKNNEIYELERKLENPPING